MVSQVDLQKETISTEQMLQCPLCGALLDEDRLDELGISLELLKMTQELKQQQMLVEGISIAAKIVKTTNQDPVLLSQLFDEKSGSLVKQMVSQVLDGMARQINPLHQTVLELKGSPSVGKIQEVALPKRFKTVASTDEFTLEKSTRGGEDVLAKVKEDNVEIGKIVVESKYVKSWNNSFMEQIKDYMKRESTAFGIIVTTAMPDDTLNYTAMIDDILVVKAEYAELAYLFMREWLKLKRALENEYANKLGQLGIREQVMHKLKEVIMDGALDKIIKDVNDWTDTVDDQVAKAEAYMANKFFPAVREATTKIRELMADLVRQHIQKIRLQLQESISAST
jgi:hypothetical protein